MPIPGANAIATALSASGFDASHFVFRGFPPPKGQARQSWLDAVSHDPVTQVVFEAPHRIRKTLAELESILVKRQIYVFRELTKINEESGIYPNICDSAWPKDVGEFTLVVSPSQDDRGLVKNRPFDHAAILALFEVLSSSGILSTEAAAELVALKFKTTSSNVLKAVKKAAILAKQQSKPLP